MPRSVKKGPFIDHHLENAINRMNSNNKKGFTKPGRVARRFHRILWDIRWRSTMAKNLFRFTLPRIWWVTNWESLRQPEHLKAIRARRLKRPWARRNSQLLRLLLTGKR